VAATGSRFTVAANHLKSKGSACTGDADANDGQGNCSGTRTQHMQQLTAFLNGLGRANMLALGASHLLICRCCHFQPSSSSAVQQA
jgi:predicted extracellular nuclease